MAMDDVTPAFATSRTRSNVAASARPVRKEVHQKTALLQPTSAAALVSAGIAVMSMVMLYFLRHKRQAPHSARVPMDMAVGSGTWAMMGMSGHGFGMGNVKKQKARVARLHALGGEYDENYDDVEVYLMHYLTYKALRSVMSVLLEEEDAEIDYQWLQEFMLSHTSVATDSETFLKELASERPDLALRISESRMVIYKDWMKKYDSLQLYERIKGSNLHIMRYQLTETVKLDDAEAVKEAEE
jgi:hypothetical protein